MCDDPTTPFPDPLVAAVERFLTASGMSPTAFGRRAANDPALVHDMRVGRDLRWSTRAKIRAFINAALAG
jgi:hypothetical protein